MKKIAPLFALIVALGALAGCQKPEEKTDGGDTPVAKKDDQAKKETKSDTIAGTYQLILPESVKARVDDAKAQGTLPKDASYPDITFTLHAGGSAEMAYSQPTPEGVQKGTGKGTWKAEGDKITVTPTEEDGKPITNPERAKPITFVWNADTTMLESEEAGPNVEKMQFKKVA